MAKRSVSRPGLIVEDEARVSVMRPTMIWLVWVVLLLYSLPLLGIIFTWFASSGWTVKLEAVPIVGSISAEFVKNLRDAFGTIVVPLLTAFAIGKIGPDLRVPLRAFALFIGLAALFAGSLVMYAVVTSSKSLQDYGKEIVASYTAITQAYPKEFLTYIAVIIGISLKKD
jgi:hypothetical protein